MKLFFACVVFGSALLQTESKAGTTPFRCDVPDEWMTGNGTIRNARPGARWPGAVVKYVLHSSLSANDRREAQRAIDDIQSKTCIRFQPRANGEAAYTSIEYDNNVCGLGHLCRTGGYQFAQFGSGCREWNTMVHELGHNLCLGHEQSRKDRDDFVHFDSCAGNEIPGKFMDNDLRGSLYDYGSQMHYQCGWCPGGWPKMSGASRCGRDIQNGLSVMDADKLNDLYNCGGCMAHRWRPIDALTDADRRNMMKFGQTEDGQPLYVCRGLINGEIAIGKYLPGGSSRGICYLPYGQQEHQFTNNTAQVFTWPSRLAGSEDKTVYRVVNATQFLNGRITANPIPSGRTSEGVTGYIAVADIEWEGKRESSIGKVFANNMGLAYFPFRGIELQVARFGVVACG